MKTFKAIIVEDEVPSRDRLKSLLSEFREIELIGEAGDGPEGVNLIDTLKPDLAFLDIQLPVFTGFEILRRISHRPQIIFVTAYDAYAVKAFEANAIDYLLKPTTPRRLRQAVDRIRTREPVDHLKLLEAVQTVLGRNNYPERLTVKCGSEIRFVPADQVRWFHAEDKYVFLHTADEKALYEETLKNLESRLDPARFVRIHKSVIINTGHITRIRRKENGQYQVQMNDTGSTKLEIGTTYLAKVRKRLGF